MGNEIPLQLAQFFRSILLGATLALLYDLTRALRIFGGRLWETFLDILISFSAVASLFLFIMAEEGELRLFILLGAVGGAVLFFTVFSGIFRPIWDFWVGLLLFPLRLGDIFLKRLHVFCKKVFSFFKRWFTIIVNPKLSHIREEREHGTQTIQTENAPRR